MLAYAATAPGPVPRPHHVVPLGLEAVGDRLVDHRLVLDDEDATAGVGHARRLRARGSGYRTTRGGSVQVRSVRRVARRSTTSGGATAARTRRPRSTWAARCQPRAGRRAARRRGPLSRTSYSPAVVGVLASGRAGVPACSVTCPSSTATAVIAAWSRWSCPPPSYSSVVCFEESPASQFDVRTVRPPGGRGR